MLLVLPVNVMFLTINLLYLHSRFTTLYVCSETLQPV